MCDRWRNKHAGPVGAASRASARWTEWWTECVWAVEGVGRWWTAQCPVVIFPRLVWRTCYRHQELQSRVVGVVDRASRQRRRLDRHRPRRRAARVGLTG